jgi:flagella basal body P-ring formation protein FlgA
MMLPCLFAALAGGLTVLLCAPAALAEIRELPVPTATIYPNDIITSAEITARKFQTTARSMVGIATSRSEIVGRQARRRLAAGKPIPLSAVSVPLAVKRGALVTASYSDAGLLISTSLIALQDGVEGDIIDARNTASGAVVRARVKSDGTLAVSGE